MTVDFIPLKLYVVKVIKQMPSRQKGAPAMRHTVVLSLRPAPGSYYFSKVRFAGRFEYAKKQSG